MEASTSDKPSTYTEMASNAASSASTTAANMKDNVFSMFGGGTKKEKKEEEEDPVDEKSGSSKAKKDAEAGEEDVSFSCFFQPNVSTDGVYRRTTTRPSLMCSSSRSFA